MDAETKVANMLDQLVNAEAFLDKIRIDYHDKEAQIIPEDVARELDELREEYAEVFKSAEDGINNLKDQIKELVLPIGKSVNGAYKQARFLNGKRSVDLKALEAIATTLPDRYKEAVLGTIKEGNPYVQFHNRK